MRDALEIASTGGVGDTRATHTCCSRMPIRLLDDILPHCHEAGLADLGRFVLYAKVY